MMKNDSGLKPLGNCILVEPYEPEIKGSSIYIPPSVRQVGQQLEMRAVVVEIGEHCWPDEPPRCAVGDLVMIAKMSGSMVVGPKDGKQYRAINCRDVFMAVTYVPELEPPVGLTTGQLLNQGVLA